MRKMGLVWLTALSLAACGSGGQASRDQIKIVGSSTVYPFTTAVAEQFVNNTSFKAPVIESTGTGGGMRLFCGGIGPQHPDMTNASRRMMPSEFDLCQRNGVTDIIEVQVGMDGIAFAESVDGPKIRLTLAEAYRALAAEPMGKPNTTKLWSDVNPALPRVPISVMGPPATSGTRDSLHELILHPGCEAAYPAIEAIEKQDKDKADDLCTRIREDGAYVDSGENDNLIVQKLGANPNAIGVFGYSYLEANARRLNGVPVNGVEPTYDNISSGQYPGARAMFIYAKKQHLKAVPGINEFLTQYTTMWDAGGPLAKRGMIASSDAARAQALANIAQKRVMQRSDLTR